MKLGHSGKILVGFDLCDNYAQISYVNVDSNTVETVSSVAGAEIFNVPAVLCKREGVNQWLYGKEALAEEGGILIKNLLSLAISGEPIQIDGSSYQPESLLTLFCKRCLGILQQIAPLDKIAAFMITCKKLDGRMVEVLEQVVGGLGLKTDKIFFQSHMESFYSYMLYQPEELWRMQTLLCEYRDSSIQVYHMECNRKTTPAVVYMEEGQYPFLSYEPMPEDEQLRREKHERMDGELLELLENVCENRMISSVYLIGEQFSEEWLKESLRYLCRGRRVFQGNNLYSKGACYGLMERMCPGENGKNHVFLGNDKLKTNVGMRINRRGQASYYALLDAGVNWYEAQETLEFYLQEGSTVELVLTSLIGGESRLAFITLEGLPQGISRLELRLYLTDEQHLVVEIEDLGFGVLRPATNRVWQEVLEL